MTSNAMSIALVSCLCLLTTSCQPSERRAVSEIIEGPLAHELDRHLSEAKARGFNGAVVVDVGGETILMKGYGWTDSTRSYEITPETRFFLASMTKGITGAAILRAQELGYLSVTDSLSSFFSGIDDHASSITLHQMLTHTAGLGSDYVAFGFTDRDSNAAQVIRQAPAVDPPAPFHYSSAGYWLSAAVLEIAVGIPFEQFVRDELFEPAGMESTGFWHETDDDNRVLVAQKLQRFPPGDLEPNWGYRGAGGVVSTASDVHRWFEAVVNGDLLTASSKQALFGPHLRLNSGIGIGYGWFRSETGRGTGELWSRGGESFGHNAVLRWYEDEDVLVIVLTNSGSLPGSEEEANRTISNEVEKVIFPNR